MSTNTNVVENNQISENKVYEEMKLADHSVGAIMMCLQKCLLEQSDITGILKDLVFVESNGELFCKNPPLIKLDDLTQEGE